MKDLTTFTTALEAIGIEYTIRTKGEYKYLFIGERRDVCYMTDSNFHSFEDSNYYNPLMLIHHLYTIAMLLQIERWHLRESHC